MSRFPIGGVAAATGGSGVRVSERDASEVPAMAGKLDRSKGLDAILASVLDCKDIDGEDPCGSERSFWNFGILGVIGCFLYFFNSFNSPERSDAAIGRPLCQV